MFINDGVDCYVDTRSELIGVFGKFCNILDTVAGSLTRSKFIGTNVHSIGTMVNGDNALLKILGWSEEFYVAWLYFVLIHNA